MRRHWFRSTPALDLEIRERFQPLWRLAGEGGLGTWERDPRGALALVILLDQFPLNMFRGQPESFATESLSRGVAERAIAAGLDRDLDEEGKMFLYLPFMHSEDKGDQDRSVDLFQAAGLAENLKWARHHREIVYRFGRFPHRNAILGRRSTPEELAWLDSAEGFRG